jgi:DNA repair protein RadC
MIQLEKKQNEELLEIVVTEKKQNDDLLDLSRQILHLTSEVRDLAGKISSTN